MVVDGPLEAIEPDRLRLQLETNVVGRLAVTQVGAATKAQLALFAMTPTRAKDMILGRASGIPRRLAG
jgi:hypothetical protein